MCIATSCVVFRAYRIINNKDNNSDGENVALKISLENFLSKRL